MRVQGRPVQRLSIYVDMCECVCVVDTWVESSNGMPEQKAAGPNRVRVFILACVLWSKYTRSFLCVMWPCCAEAALCVSNNTCDYDFQLRERPPSCVSEYVDPPASCDKAQFELSLSHTHLKVQALLAAGCAGFTYSLPGLLNVAWSPVASYIVHQHKHAIGWYTYCIGTCAHPR